jgi:hypothetical protein
VSGIVNALVGGSAAQVALILSNKGVIEVLSSHLRLDIPQETLGKMLFAFQVVSTLDPVRVDGRSPGWSFGSLRRSLVSPISDLIAAIGPSARSELTRSVLKTIECLYTPCQKGDVADCTRCVELIAASLVETMNTPNADGGCEQSVCKVAINALTVIVTLSNRFSHRTLFSVALEEQFARALPPLIQSMKSGLPHAPDPLYLSACVECVLTILKVAAAQNEASLGRLRAVFESAHGPRKLAVLCLLDVNIELLSRQSFKSLLWDLGIYTKLVTRGVGGAAGGASTKGVFVGDLDGNNFGQGVLYESFGVRKGILHACRYTMDSNPQKRVTKSITIPLSSV